MNYLLSLNTKQLRQAADLKGKIEALHKQLATILGAAAIPAPKKKFKMSAAAKAKLSALAKARWAKVKKTGKKSL